MIEIHRNNSGVVRITLRQKNGANYNVPEGNSLVFSVKKSVADPDTDIVISKTAIGNGWNQYEFILTGDDTDILPGIYKWDLKDVTANLTLAIGDLRILEVVLNGEPITGLANEIQDIEANIDFNNIVIVLDYSRLTGKPKLNGVEFNGDKTTADYNISYEDLTDKPDIPEKLSDLTNDSDFISETAINNKDAETLNSAKSYTDTVAEGKQKKLIEGENVDISEEGVISFTGGGASYTAGNGIKIENDTISLADVVDAHYRIANPVDFTVIGNDFVKLGNNVLYYTGELGDDEYLVAEPYGQSSPTGMLQQVQIDTARNDRFMRMSNASYPIIITRPHDSDTLPTSFARIYTSTGDDPVGIMINVRLLTPYSKRYIVVDFDAMDGSPENYTITVEPQDESVMYDEMSSTLYCNLSIIRCQITYSNSTQTQTFTPTSHTNTTIYNVSKLDFYTGSVGTSSQFVMTWGGRIGSRGVPIHLEQVDPISGYRMGIRISQLVPGAIERDVSYNEIVNSLLPPAMLGMEGYVLKVVNGLPEWVDPDSETGDGGGGILM